MSNRSIFILGATIGGTAGGCAPGLWGGSDLGGWSILLSTIGGLLGIWVAYKLVRG
jgi:hypothetical protein